MFPGPPVGQPKHTDKLQTLKLETVKACGNADPHSKLSKTSGRAKEGRAVLPKHCRGRLSVESLLSDASGGVSANRLRATDHDFTSLQALRTKPGMKSGAGGRQTAQREEDDETRRFVLLTDFMHGRALAGGSRCPVGSCCYRTPADYTNNSPTPEFGG